MAIDTGGTWWVGDSPSDIDEYLRAYLEGSVPVHKFRQSRCGCTSVRFRLEADDLEGTAKRSCIDCGADHFICDSEEYWDEANPKRWICVCGSDTANLGVAYSIYDEPDADRRPVIRWLSIGTRCHVCGILGCFAGWKVAYEPSHHLLELA